jgi:hypothetical protein
MTYTPYRFDNVRHIYAFYVSMSIIAALKPSQVRIKGGFCGANLPILTSDVDGRVKPGHDDPHGGLRIFVSKNTSRRAAARIREARLTQQNQH